MSATINAIKNSAIYGRYTYTVSIVTNYFLFKN